MDAKQKLQTRKLQNQKIAIQFHLHSIEGYYQIHLQCIRRKRNSASISRSQKMAIVGVWLEVESLRFDAAGQKLSFEILIKPLKGLKPDEAAVEALEGKLAAVLDVYEA
ncbi:hypothetical protein ACS0TY_006048 [Phlomoides rotata]